VPSVLLLADPMPPASSPRRSALGCPGGADPYVVLGVLIEGAVQTLVEHISKERQAEIAATLKQLLDQRLKACGVPDSDD
jgi:hypothetical protein